MRNASCAVLPGRMAAGVEPGPLLDAGVRYSVEMAIVRTVVAAMMVAALAACSHAMPTDAERGAAGGADSDPWRVKGSVTAGPMSGAPQGPYGARP